MYLTRLCGALLVAALGCAGDLDTGLESWPLVADDNGGLVDVIHPDFGAYPNPRAVDQVEVTLHSDGRLCADADGEVWCGGPMQGIPYLARATVEGDSVCLRVLDMFRNLVFERCGLAEEFTIETPAAGCRDVNSAHGACRICTADDGTVTENSCAANPYAGDMECYNDDQALVMGAYLFQTAFNAGLARAGMDFELRVPTSPAWYVDFDEGGISLADPSCADILEYLDDEFSDDHPGTDDYVFGPEAMAECENQGRCRIGQLVTRSMAEACQDVPVGCDMEMMQRAIIGSGGFAVQEICEGESIEDDKVGVSGTTGIEDCVGSPLILDLASDGLALRGFAAGAAFDLWGTGLMSGGWLAGSDDALLALDLDGDGAITSGRELFGEATGGWAPDGFAALARHDHNGDRVIDAADPVYASLLAWIDNGDAVSTPDELRSLSAAGVTRIALEASHVGELDEFGNELGLEAGAERSDGSSTPVIDVWFRIGKR